MFIKYQKLYLGVLTVISGLIIGHVVYANSFDGQVVSAKFTTKMKNNKPTDEVLVLENDIDKIYFYSEVEGMSGMTVIHRWEHRGEIVFKEKFKITKDKQGLTSSYKLGPARTGKWTVIITNDKGWPLKAVIFKYVRKGSFAGKGIKK